MIHKKDTEAFHSLQKRQEKEWEDMCRNCGACCGAMDGDPCEHLVMKEGRSFCLIYDKRFGMHNTVKGKEFKCVPIRNILHESWPGYKNCAYKKQIKDNYIKELVNECSCNRSIK